MWLQPDGHVSGTAFSSATNFQLLDSITVKVTDPSVTGGYRLFTFQLQNNQRTLLFYIKPTNGALCYEGCGTYRFEK